jgi:hypothetical protein
MLVLKTLGHGFGLLRLDLFVAALSEIADFADQRQKSKASERTSDEKRQNCRFTLNH